MRLLSLTLILWGMLAGAAPATAARSAPAGVPFAPPALTELSPANNATGVAPDASLRVVFDQPVAKGVGAVRVYRPDGTERFPAIGVDDAAVTLSSTSQEATIALPAALSPGETVYVNVDAGAFVNATAEPFAGIAGTGAWRFTTDAAPVPVGTDPANGATEVPPGGPFTVTFSENVQPGTGNVRVFYDGTDHLVAVTDPAVSVQGNQLTLTPATPLPAGTGVSITLDAGVVKDAAGIPLAGPTNPADWRFTTNYAPVVTALLPLNGSRNVPVGSALQLTFSEPVRQGTGNITLFEGATAVMTIGVNSGAVSISGNTVIVTPLVGLPSGATLSVRMPAGAFTDLTNLPFAGIADAVTWAFSVADATVPVVTSLSPAHGATGVGLGTDLVLTFSEPVRKGSGNITITHGGTSQSIPVGGASVFVPGGLSTTVTVNPADFPAGATVAVAVPATAFADESGNAFAGTTGSGGAAPWRFDADAAPVVGRLSPANGATGVAVNPELVLTFTETVRKGSGSITLFAGATPLQTIAVTSTAVTVSGNRVGIRPGNLPSGATLSVQMPAGTFTDLAGIPFAGIADAATWSFAVADATAPAATALSPANGAVNVGVNAPLSITFNEPIRKGGGTITIYQGSSPLQTLAVTGPSVSVSGNTALISPSVPFPSEAALFVIVPGGAFTDASGNAFAGINDPAGWSFRVADVTAPVVSSYSPANGSVGVSPNGNLVMTFNEPVRKGAGNIVIRQGSTILHTLAVTGAGVSVTGPVVIVTPPAALPSGAGLHVQMPAGAFLDPSNNAFAGIGDANTWAFAVADVTPPAATAFSPANNAVDVAANASLVVTFSEPVLKGSGNITIFRGSTIVQTLAAADAAVTVQGNAVTIRPEADFEAGAVLHVQIAAGTFTDASGNAFAGITAPTAWRFTVADRIAPVLTDLSPDNGATGVAFNARLVLNFSEPVRKGTGNLVVYRGGTPLQMIAVGSAAVVVSGSTVTVTPTALPSEALLNVQVAPGTFLDLSNNAFGGLTSAADWAFTVADVNAPSVAGLLPANNATGVSPAAQLVITFSEAVRKGSGNITLFRGTTALQVIGVADEAVAVNGNAATITPPNAFPSGADLHVRIGNGAFLDLENNPYAGISDGSTWRFSVADTQAPTVSSLSPANGAAQVLPTASLVLTFNEPVLKGDGSLTLLQGDVPLQTINVGNANVTVSGNVVTVVPAGNLPSATTLRVTVSSGAFTDGAGNPFAGISGANGWAFTVADVVPPTLTALSPANGAVGVAPGAPLLMTFNKPVSKGSGSIILIQGAASQTIPVGGGAVTIEGNTVRIVPPANFPSGGVVSVLMFAGVFTDASGNPFSGISEAATWRFTVADVDAPLVTNLLPAPGATGVSPGANLAITFNKPVQKGSGFVTLTYGSTSQPIAVGTGAVTVTGSTVLIDPPANFPSGARVNVQMAAGVFTDLAGNPFAGIADALSWTFTVVDVNAPTVAALSPASGAVAAPLNGPLQITFSEPVRKGSGNITIYQGATAIQVIPVGSAGVRVDDQRVTIAPDPFPSGARLHVQMPAGAFRDLTDNPFAGIGDGNGWHFTTLDTIPPRLTALSPADNATRVNPGASLILRFSEPVRKGNGQITIHQGAGAANQVLNVSDAAVFVADSSVTIKPANDFPSGGQVYVTVPRGTFADAGGNAFAGILTATAWNFGVSDVTPPAIATTSPLDGATEVPINATLTLTIDKPVRKGTSGYVLINQGATSQFIPVGSSNLVASGNTLTITPPNKFPYNTEVSVQIPSETVTDAAGNAFAGITEAGQWTFRTVAPPDLLAPAILALAPADNAIRVPADSRLILTFNEPVQKGSGSITLTEGSKLVLLDVNDQRVGVAGNTVTITFTENFPLGVEVSVQIAAGAFKDVTGNVFPGIADATVWNFLVAPPEDRQPPTMVALLPENGATAVPVAAHLQIRLSEKVRIGRGDIVLEAGSYRQVIPVTGHEVRIVDSVVVINPPLDLPGGATVQVTVTEGAFADLADNGFPGIATPGAWRFSVADAADKTAPALTELSPADGSTDAAAETPLVLVFSEEVRKGTGTLRINAGGVVEHIPVTDEERVVVAGNRVTVRPSPFTAGVRVMVTLLSGVFTDAAGNSFAGLGTGAWTFRTRDNVPPRLTGLLPADDALGVPVNTNLVVTFNKPVRKGAGSVSLTAGGIAASIAVSDARVTVSDNLLIINPEGDFAPNAAVTITLPAGLVQDRSGNPSPAVATETEWNFSVGGAADRAAPAMALLSPADDATDVPAGTPLTIAFDEPVLKGNGLITVTVNGQPQTYDAGTQAVQVAGNAVRITPREKFPYGAAVQVTFPAGLVTDASNNAFGGIRSAADWDFTVSPAPPLAIVAQRFPETILFTASEVPAYITVDAMPEGTTAELVYRGIAGTGWARMPLLAQERVIEAPLTRPQFDQIGLEYYFELTLADNRKVASDTGRTYLYYPAGGLPVPNLRFGARPQDYQMFSIPLSLEDNAVAAVLEDNLGEYKKTRWRLFHYNDTTGTEYDPAAGTLARLQAGAGYWLIVRNQPDVLNTGAGTTVQVDQQNPYRVQLRKGWNQVGNPYNFSLSWADVRNYNNNPPGLSNLYVFEEAYRESDVLKRFQGAFVFAATDLLLDIPVTRNVAVHGGRRSAEAQPFAENALWEMQFGLRGGEVSYELSGVGMHPNGRAGHDDFDRVLLPRFGSFADVSTPHPEFFAPRFARDVAPVREHYRWELTVTSNLPAQTFELDWRAYLSADFDRHKRLVLYDPARNRLVDLLTATTYPLWLDGNAKLVVLYGSPEYVQEQLKPDLCSLGPVAPNPFADQTRITFGLADGASPYGVQVHVYNLNGQLVRKLADATYPPGAYTLTWDGRDDTGRRLSPGLYICRLSVHGPRGSQVMSEKIVIR